MKVRLKLSAAIDRFLWRNFRAYRKAQMRKRVHVVLSWNLVAPTCEFCGTLSDVLMLRNGATICMDCQESTAMTQKEKIDRLRACGIDTSEFMAKQINNVFDVVNTLQWAVADMVAQHCPEEEPGVYSAGFLSANASALRLLSDQGAVSKIHEAPGLRVVTVRFDKHPFSAQWGKP